MGLTLGLQVKRVCGKPVGSGLTCTLDAGHDNECYNADDVAEFVAHDLAVGIPDVDVLRVKHVSLEEIDAKYGPPDPEPPVEDNPYVSDPRILELQQQLTELMANMSEWGPEVSTLSGDIDKVKKEEKEFLDFANEKIAAFQRRTRELRDARKAIEEQLRNAEYQKDRIIADIDHRVEAIDARKMLEEARQQWRDIIDKYDWEWTHVVREYQMVGIEFIASGVTRDLGGIALLDQMGLGKTLQARGAIDLIQAHPQYEKMLGDRLPNWNKGDSWSPSVLWVCPDSIKYSTRNELAKWSNAPVMVLEGTPGIRKHMVNLAHSAGMTLIVGYAQLRNRGEDPVTPELFDHDWPIVVMDEVHKAKNRERSTFLNLKKIIRRSAYAIPMTGTPVDNKAAEFWTILNIITEKGKRAGEFDSFPQFERRYLWSGSNQWMFDAFDKLMASVSDMVIRRRKDEVLKDLPEKQRELRIVEMTGAQREYYDQMRTQFFIWLDEQKENYLSTTSVLAQLTRLRQIALLPSGVKIDNGDGSFSTIECDESAKIDEAMALIREAVESDEKILIFSNFNAPLHHIQKLIAEEGLTWTDHEGNIRPVLSEAITGDTPKEVRPSIEARFNDASNDVRVVVGNIAAMGLGLNLQQACSQAIFLDLYWNPGANEQAEDRLHRMGQQNAVTIHIIQAEHSVDAFIARILEDKVGVSNAMIERSSLRHTLEDLI